MSCPRGWKRIYFVIIAISPFFFFLSHVNAATLQPRVCGVTTKMFSVVWTTGGTYDSCGIKLYTDENHNTEIAVNPNQIIIETAPGYPGAGGKAFRIAMVSLVGLDYNTPYYFGVTQDSQTPFHYGQVTLESLRGLESNDPNVTDIVSNDTVHKAVYIGADGTSPALGALVLADIYNPNGITLLSDYPISAWVGDGLPGGTSTTYDPNNPSYKHYAVFEMNNLFGGSGSGDNYKFSLQLQGGELIKFTTVCGTQAILGKGSDDYVISWGRVESIEKLNDEPVSMPKVSASFRFGFGMNMFALPFDIPDGYTTKMLFEAIEAAHGGAKIVTAIYTYKNGWIVTERDAFDEITNSTSFDVGNGCFVQMKSSMTNEIIFYGKPNSVSVSLYPGLNMVALPQIPAYYRTGNLMLDIEKPSPEGGGAGAKKVTGIFYFDGGWGLTDRDAFDEIQNSKYISNTKFYFVQLKIDANIIVDWDPFVVE